VACSSRLDSAERDLIGIIIGFVLGILGSLIAWIVAIGLLTPALKIRDSIELIRSSDQHIKYRFAVRNQRIFRNAQDVTIKARCSYRTQRAIAGRPRIRQTFEVPVDDGWVPLIRSQWYWHKHRQKGRTGREFWAQYPVLLPDQIPGRILQELPKDENGQADLRALLGAEYYGRINLIVIAYDSWSGTKKLFIKRFRQEAISELEEADAASRLKASGSDQHNMVAQLHHDDESPAELEASIVIVEPIEADSDSGEGSKSPDQSRDDGHADHSLR
jgi:hypothetical protein